MCAEIQSFMSDMLVRLYDLPDLRGALETLQQGGCEVRRALALEKHQIVPWVREHFSDVWASECEVAFSRQPVACFVASKQGALCGFACYEATCRNFFGPVGIHAEARASGIGKALVLSCLHAMAAEGYAYAIIGSAGPAEFFRKTVGAVAIEHSTPGIYHGMLSA